MWLDILTGTLFIIAILQGYKNGLIRAIVSFLSLYIGLIVAFQFAGWVAKQLKEHTKIESHWLPFISFLIILILVLILLKWASNLLQQTAEWLMLGWLNKLLGMLLYGFIYFTIFSAILYFLQLLGVLEADPLKEAFCYKYLNEWWPYCMGKMGGIIPALKNTITTFSSSIK